VISIDRQAEQMRVLHDEHAAVLWRYVLRLTGDAARAQDVVQETLLRAWRRPGVLDQSESSARAWLFTVARNLVIDQQRSALARREISTDEVPDVASTEESDTLLDSWLIAEALLALSDQHRAVIIECYYHGRPVAEAALRLEIPAGTVKSRLHYALRALKLALQEMGVTS
jgi:RNA polymerase sigma-70 factor, ECF subfamily